MMNATSGFVLFDWIYFYSDANLSATKLQLFTRGIITLFLKELHDSHFLNEKNTALRLCMREWNCGRGCVLEMVGFFTHLCLAQDLEALYVAQQLVG